jgi:hypothetical protein
MKLRIVCVVVAFLSFALSLASQTASNISASAQVPPLIQFSNIATDQGGNTLSGVVSITFSLYAVQRGGDPLWTETQTNIQLDPTGHYSVQLGITKPNGVPTTLFTSGEARWLGVRIAEQAEQPRVLLVSVPYALKAGDAATIGGLPPSAFMLANPARTPAVAVPLDAPLASAPPPTGDPVTGTGTVNYLPLWDTTSDIISSALSQSGTGSTAKIGIGTATPASTLDIKGGSTVRGILSLPATGTAAAAAGKNSQALSFTASAYNSSTPAAVNQVFRWQAEPAGNDTAAPSGTLNLLFGEGTATPASTGLYIASNGLIHFATGQTFGAAGSGTVTSVATGLGLTGGPITASGTLTIDTSVVPQLAVSNIFTGQNNFTGTQTISSTSGNGVLAKTTSSSGSGLYGSNSATTGSANGVYGQTSSPSGSGVAAINFSPSGNSYGVSGQSLSPTGTGVYGLGNGTGVTGASNSASGNGVYGSNNATTGGGNGVYGITTTPTGTGVVGVNNVATTGYGVYGQSSNTGVYGTGNGSGLTGTSSSSTGSGVVGIMNAGGGYAGYFQGNTAITGNATVGGSLTIGGDKPMTHSPRMTFSGTVASFTTSPQAAGYFIPDQPIVITRFTVAVGGGQNSFCSSPEFMSLTINGNASAATVNAEGNPDSTSFTDSGSLNIQVSAGTPIYMYGNSASGAGCQSGNNITATVEYAMQ